MKGTISEVYVTVKLGDYTIQNKLYQDYNAEKYAIFLFRVTCDSDPRYHFKYLLLNAEPFKYFDYKSTQILGVYQVAAADYMFMQALNSITDINNVNTCPGWWATKNQIGKFETLKVSSKVNFI